MRVILDNKFFTKVSDQDLKRFKSTGFANILGHRKNYMSELINGVRPFSNSDIMVMHRLLKISLENLMAPFLREDIVIYIKQIIDELNKPGLGFKKEDIEKILI